MSEDEQDGPKSDSPGMDEKYCKKCGEIIDKEAEICPECGVRQQKTGENQNINVSVENQNQSIQSQNGNSGQKIQGNKSRGLAAILAIFLGGFGVHKFYLGQAGRGLLFLAFFWTFIPAIIAFIQGISYLAMSDQKFAQKFG